MRLAVTGGGGFLGYHLCHQLAHRFEEIRVIDIAPINPQEYPGNVKCFQADVRDEEALERILAGVDMVVHGAAALPLWTKKNIVTTNVDGTRNVLKIAVKQGIPRVVHISSTAVYGIPKKHPIEENDPLRGVGPYGESKVTAERICEEYRKKGLCVPVVRPKTFIGTGRLGVFQILYDWVKCGKKIPIIGNGKNRYQLLEVEDLVKGLELLMTQPAEKVNDTFNVGAKEFGTVQDDLEALCEYAGSGARPMPVPSWLARPLLEVLWTLRLSPLYKWVYATADKDSFVSIEKIQKQLGWTPKYTNAQALIKSYQWYLDHEKEIQGVGLTHRSPWRQGILAILKKFL